MGTTTTTTLISSTTLQGIVGSGCSGCSLLYLVHFLQHELHSQSMGEDLEKAIPPGQTLHKQFTNSRLH